MPFIGVSEKHFVSFSGAALTNLVGGRADARARKTMRLQKSKKAL